MTREEIIKMARQAGFLDYELDDGTTDACDKRYEAFAKLVADKEREKLNQMVDSIKQEAETGLVIGDEEGMESALEQVLVFTCAHLGIERGEA